ncbi:class I SAM-dependent methyltransferase [Flavobacterium capsici]|uniref:Class I SAM-dependent methyltransferase n=1 Tax=Flavobacterium capsici TaxID=3075618 RepID=A0AA96J4W5_9FLAO|nr:MULTISPECIES: class I SAM-dependent methyltransferase [unclassified Flavobacterium]WNM18466.1 class I SAM-dependent methyltransferase [Flavobacterium sp. PMR2A8]WNM22517.1 class I SAM-dependent methyltransferase [Flavobacterium sp. PMTSA4]
MENIKEHWETVFSTKKEKEVSWYQSKPETSINFFINNAISKEANIIDIGGGDSYLIDNLLDLGYTNLYLLDISSNAIEKIKKRLGEKAAHVNFIVSNILDFESEVKFDVWHDRASFHFLTKPEDIQKYRSILNNLTNKKAHFFLGTFSENGPKKCSGLDISQYTTESLNEVFKDEFLIKNSFTQNHKTPFDTEQNFVFCDFIKK